LVISELFYPQTWNSSLILSWFPSSEFHCFPSRFCAYYICT
jgi:hypothetical protein